MSISNERRTTVALICVLVASFLVYAPSLGNDFAMDGVHMVRDNPMASQLQPIGTYFTSHYWERVGEGSNLFRPITVLSYALSTSWFGDWFEGAATVHHVGNVLLHVLATLLTYLLLVRLGISRVAAVAGAFLFGVHAIHSEVVAGVVGRAELFAFVFGAIGLCGCVRVVDGRVGGGRWIAGGLAALAFFLAYASKENAAAWLPFVPFYFVARRWLRDASAPLAAALRPALVPIVIALIPFVVFLALRAAAIEDVVDRSEVKYVVNPLFPASTTTRIVTATVIWGFGLYKTLLPIDLVSDYGAHVFTVRDSFFDPLFLFVLVGLAACVGLGLRSGRRWPLGLLAVATFFGFGFLTTNIPLPIGTIFGERLYYTPSLALSFLVAWWIQRAGSRRGPWVVLGVWSIVSIVVILGRNPAWKNDETLFLTDVESQPTSARLHVVVAGLRAAKQEFDAATEHCRRAIAIAPEYSASYVELATLQIGRREYGEAETTLRRAGECERTTRYDERMRRLYLQDVLLNTDRATEALAILRETESMFPDQIDVWSAYLQAATGRVPRKERVGILERARGHVDALAANADTGTACAVLDIVIQHSDSPAALKKWAREKRRELGC